jgi:chromosomal replication initiation ATPase DnaA
VGAIAELTATTDRKGAIGLAQAVAAHAYGLSLTELSDRTRNSGRARQVAMYLARVSLKLGLRETARGFRRNHRAVAHAYRRVEDAREDPAFDRTVEWLEALVRRTAGVAA